MILAHLWDPLVCMEEATVVLQSSSVSQKVAVPPVEALIGPKKGLKMMLRLCPVAGYPWPGSLCPLERPRLLRYLAKSIPAAIAHPTASLGAGGNDWRVIPDFFCH